STGCGSLMISGSFFSRRARRNSTFASKGANEIHGFPSWNSTRRRSARFPAALAGKLAEPFNHRWRAPPSRVRRQRQCEEGRLARGTLLSIDEMVGPQDRHSGRVPLKLADLVLELFRERFQPVGDHAIPETAGKLAVALRKLSKIGRILHRGPLMLQRQTPC